MHRIIIFSALPLLLLLNIACGSESEGSSANDFDKELHLAESTETYLLKDDMELLDNINIVQPLDDNRMIIVDNKPSVNLFENHEMTSRIGVSGEGPCEYNDVSSVEVSGDTLFVLSAMQSKIISYSIEDGNCLNEESHEDLSSKFYMHRSGNEFILGSMAYSLGTPDSTVLMHRLTDEGSMKSLELSVGDLNRVKSPVSMRASGHDFSITENQLFAYFPLTSKIFVWDLHNDSHQSFPVNIDIKRDEMKAAGDNIDRLLEVISSDFQFVTKTLTINGDIGIVYQENATDNSSELRYFLQLYSPEGAFLGKYEGSHNIMAVHDNQFIELREVADPNSDYSYEIAYRSIAQE